MINDPKKMIIVAGFNCRPIATACTKAGFRPLIIDYFGDLDIRSLTTGGHYFIEESHGSGDTDAFRLWVLTAIERAVTRAGKQVDPSRGKPWIIVGSGFDDEPYFWKKFAELGTFLGNSAKNVQQARSLSTLSKMMKENGIKIEIPRTKRVVIEKSTDLAVIFQEIRQKFLFPFLVKQSRTAGGSGIDFIEDEACIDEFINRMLITFDHDPRHSETYNVQEYVGNPTSRDISVIVCNDRIVCKTRQIIGDPRLNAPKRFSYCGNSIPLEPMQASLEIAIEHLVKTLYNRCGLRGLYGIDLVMVNDKLYLVEVNPRVPGSLEPASIALGTNLITDHIKSFMKGKQSRGLAGHKYEPKYHVIKFILFTGQKFTMPVLDRIEIAGQVHDITQPGMKMTPGMPIITYLYRGPLDIPEENEKQAWHDVDVLYNRFNGGARE